MPFWFFFPSSEDNQDKREDDALAKWVADPANTAWMESKYQWAQNTAVEEGQF